VSAAEETAQSLVDVWADEVRRLVPEVRELRQRYDGYSRALDYDWTLAGTTSTCTGNGCGRRSTTSCGPLTSLSAGSGA
jgi:hypothetical protein